MFISRRYLVDNDDKVNRENHLNGETIREEFVEASLSSMSPHNKEISRENDDIKLESSSNYSFHFNPNAAGDQGQRQQITLKEQTGESYQ